MSPIGDFIIRVSLVALVFGLWVSGVFAFPVFFGQSFNPKIDTISLMILYIVLIPILLLYPAWRVHVAMASAKSEMLTPIAKRLQTLLAQNEPARLLSDDALLRVLQDRYRALSTELRVWPFRRVTIRRYGASALIPLIGPAISAIVKWL